MFLIEMADDSQRIKYVYADSTNRDVTLKEFIYAPLVAAKGTYFGE